MKAIYLENNATTPVDPRVLDAMLPYLTEHFGNAASKSHRFGWIAEEAVEKARGQAAQLIGVSAEVGRFNTQEEIEQTIEQIAETVRSLRGGIGAERRATTT